MDSRRYEAFVAAVDANSMSGAAKELGYTPSGIIRLVNALEDELGFALLARTSTGVTCTAEGERMLPIFRQMVELGKKAQSTGERIRGLAEGTLVIGTVFSLATAWLAPVLARYQELYPEVHVRVLSGGDAELRAMLDAHQVDCCLVHAVRGSHDWVPLGRHELVAWLPPASPLVRHEAVLLAEYAGQPFVSTRAGETASLEDLLVERAIEPDVKCEVSDYYAAYRVVDEGRCMALGCEGLAQGWRGAVIERPLSPRRFAEYGIATLPVPSLSPAVEEFIAVARQVVER